MTVVATTLVVQPDGCVILEGERYRVPERVYPWSDTEQAYELKAGDRIEVAFDADGQLHGHLAEQDYQFKLQREEIVLGGMDGTEVPFEEVKMEVVGGGDSNGPTSSPQPSPPAGERGKVSAATAHPEHIIRPRLSREQWTLLAHYLDTRIDQLSVYLSDEEELHDGREQAMDLMRVVQSEQRWSVVPDGMKRAIEDTIRLCRRGWEVNGLDYAAVREKANLVTPDYLMDFVMEEIYRDSNGEGGVAA